MVSARSIILCALGAAAVFAGTPAAAATLTVRVVDAAGHPVSDAVVSLEVPGEPAPRPRVSGSYSVIQQDTRFKPFVSVVPVGATVAFPNFDPFRHHVYSFSAAKRFELKLFAKDQTRSVTFDHAGIVAVGCNIHDTMSAYIFVTDTAWATKVSPGGAANFFNAPRSGAMLRVWHPYLRAPGQVQSRRIAGVGADRVETVVVALRPPPMHMGAY